MNDFHDGRTRVFLVSLEAGGVGLNLTAADTVTGAVDVTIDDSSFTSGTYGIFANGGAVVTNRIVVSNNSEGLYAGGSAAIYLSNATISGNQVAFGNFATIYSYRNNVIRGNTSGSDSSEQSLTYLSAADRGAKEASSVCSSSASAPNPLCPSRPGLFIYSDVQNMEWRRNRRVRFFAARAPCRASDRSPSRHSSEAPAFILGAASASCRARLDRVEFRADLSAPLHEIVIGLQAEKETLRDAEIPREPQIRIRSDRPLAEDNLIDAAWRHANGSSESRLAQPQWDDELLGEDFTGGRVRQEISHGSR